MVVDLHEPLCRRLRLPLSNRNAPLFFPAKVDTGRVSSVNGLCRDIAVPLIDDKENNMGEPCGFLPKRQIAQRIAGYRGEPETWPKNSLRGFDEVLRAGARCIETDVITGMPTADAVCD